VAERVDKFKAAERQRQDRIDAAVGVPGQWVLRHGQDHDRDIEARVAQFLDQLRAFDLALKQQIDHYDVGPELLGRLDDFRPVV